MNDRLDGAQPDVEGVTGASYERPVYNADDGLSEEELDADRAGDEDEEEGDTDERPARRPKRSSTPKTVREGGLPPHFSGMHRGVIFGAFGVIAMIVIIAVLGFLQSPRRAALAQGLRGTGGSAALAAAEPAVAPSIDPLEVKKPAKVASSTTPAADPLSNGGAGNGTTGRIKSPAELAEEEAYAQTIAAKHGSSRMELEASAQISAADPTGGSMAQIARLLGIGGGTAGTGGTGGTGGSTDTTSGTGGDEAQLAALQAQMRAAGVGGGTLFTQSSPTPAPGGDTSGSGTTTQTGSSGVGYIPSLGRCELRMGTKIYATLLTDNSSDTPGVIEAQVSMPVFDSATEKILVVPPGAMLEGVAQGKVVQNQRVLLASFTRLNQPSPDNRKFNLGSMPAISPNGASGIPATGVVDHTENPYRRSLLMSLIQLPSQLLSHAPQVVVNTASNVADAAQTGSTYAPETVTVSSGTPIVIYVMQDLPTDCFRSSGAR